MLPLLPALVGALRGHYARLRAIGPFALLIGTPRRATIANHPDGGYRLLIDYTDGREWLDLPRSRAAALYHRPTDTEFDAATRLLTARALTWELPWQLDTEANLTCPVTRKEHHR
jgi:hypothetical protein